MKGIEEAVWAVTDLDPEEKLVLLALARNTYRTPREDLAIAGLRALRSTACGMAPAELDMVLASLERRGLIAPVDDPDGPVGRHTAALDRAYAQDGPWKAWLLDVTGDGKEAGR